MSIKDVSNTPHIPPPTPSDATVVVAAATPSISGFVSLSLSTAYVLLLTCPMQEIRSYRDLPDWRKRVDRGRCHVCSCRGQRRQGRRYGPVRREKKGTLRKWVEEVGGEGG